MFNPFYPFTSQLLERFIKSEKAFFVRQTFSRGKTPFEEDIKGCFLITHYGDKTAAEAHCNAIAGDPNRYLYNWRIEQDQQKLKVAASQPAGYKIFSALLQKDWENHITDKVKKKIRNYIESIGWRPGKGETVLPNFYLQFGELYVHLKYGTRQTKVKFEDIEETN